ncbi:MAG: hypothetical protein Q9227_005392 [Pyrenula ochraceoflavens]
MPHWRAGAPTRAQAYDALVFQCFRRSRSGQSFSTTSRFHKRDNNIAAKVFAHHVPASQQQSSNRPQGGLTSNSSHSRGGLMSDEAPERNTARFVPSRPSIYRQHTPAQTSGPPSNASPSTSFQSRPDQPSGPRLLRRSVSPQQFSQPDNRGARNPTRPPPNRPPRPPMRRSPSARTRPRRNRRQENENDENEEDPQEEDAKLESWLDPTPPRHPIPYKPEPVTIDSLREDWPAFPTSSTTTPTPSSSTTKTSSAPPPPKIALEESLSESLRWLSRRFAHGHEPTTQLARRLLKGDLVQFKSERERADIEDLARQLALEDADRINAAAGDEREYIPPVEVDFQPLEKSDREELVGAMVRGNYKATGGVVGQLQEQKGKGKGNTVVEGIARNLAGNETYRGEEKGKFMKKLESMMAVMAPRQPQAQQRQQS